MNTILGDALNEALKQKKTDYSEFKWKGPKVRNGDKYTQESVRLIDATPAQLISYYQHCEKMLYNEDPKNLGRYNVFEQVKEEMHSVILNYLYDISIIIIL